MKLGIIATTALLIISIANSATAEVTCFSQNNGSIVCDEDYKKQDNSQREENRRRDWNENRRRDRDENRRRDWDENRRRDRDENRRRDRDEYRSRDRDEYRNRDRDDIYDDIDEIYQEVLDRDADRPGLRTYRKRLESGWSLEQVRRDIVNSSEAEQAINRIYQEELGRDADRQGLSTYRKRIRSGWSLERVRREIANSKEARDRRR